MIGLLLAVLGFGLGVIATAVVLRRRRPRTHPHGPDPLLGTEEHVIDLFRRAYGGTVASLVGFGGDAIVVRDPDGPPDPTRTQRTTAAARLAMEDGRRHVLRTDVVLVAVGDGEFGCALLLGDADTTTERLDALGDEMRRLLGELRVGHELASRRPIAHRIPDWLAIAPHSPDGLAHALAEAVRKTTGRPTAVALRDRVTHNTSIVAVSQGGDRMLFGVIASSDSAVGRACIGDIPVVGPTFEDLLGQSRSDRRLRRSGGTAFPLRDGREGIGALIVFGNHDSLDAGTLERILWLTVDAGPRLASALEVRAAETRAMTDPLTGLPNRRALDRALARWSQGACSMLCVDLDHFKQFNDGHGHVAGDAALKHVAQVFRRTLRENDLAARIGGEEFALWLPDTPLPRAVDVGERVRGRLADSALHWDGSDLKMTCSVGVASVPESVGQVANLFTAADAALYKAKRAGRNRVHASLRGNPSS